VTTAKSRKNTSVTISASYAGAKKSAVLTVTHR
jgi:hypothetical protein